MAEQNNVKAQACTGCPCSACPEVGKSVFPILLIVLGVIMLARNLTGKQVKKREAANG